MKLYYLCLQIKEISGKFQRNKAVRRVSIASKEFFLGALFCAINFCKMKYFFLYKEMNHKKQWHSCRKANKKSLKLTEQSFNIIQPCIVIWYKTDACHFLRTGFYKHRIFIYIYRYRYVFCKKGFYCYTSQLSQMVCLYWESEDRENVAFIETYAYMFVSACLALSW